MSKGSEIGPNGPDPVSEGGKGAGGGQKEPGSVEAHTSWLRKISEGKMLSFRKRALFLIAALFLGGAGAWGFLQHHHWGTEGVNQPRSLAENDLRQEDLGRFYIPLHNDAPNRAVVIDWSVAWDVLSSVRYRKAELAVRDRIYESLTALAAQEEKWNEEVRRIEEAISMVLGEFLRNEAYSVKVTGVKVY